MSWLDRYTKNLIITTGDQKQYTLFTRPAFSRELDFNSGDFQFVDVEGELVKKRKLRSRKFPLEFYFIGENHIEDSKLFEDSLKNEKPCIIDHPYYDTILAQILAVKFDDTELNITKVTCVAVETINDEGVRIVSNPLDVISLKQIEITSLISEEPNITPTITDIDTLKENTTANYGDAIKIIKIPAEAEEYFNAYNEAITTINAITASPILAMQALTNFLLLPAQFTANVQDRINTILTQWHRLRLSLNALTSVTSKRLYEYQGSCLISSLCVAAVSPLENNYANASAALGIIDSIQEAHSQYQSDLDDIQSNNAGDPTAYVPGFNIQNGLNDLVLLTTANLYSLALSGRKEFSFVLKEDSNVILLTHRFYGLDELDNNIVDFINNNNLTYKEIALGLSKGKTIIYYK